MAEHEDELAVEQRQPLAVCYGRRADGYAVTIVVCSDGTVFEHTATFAGTEEDAGPIVRVDAWRALPPIPGTSAAREANRVDLRAQLLAKMAEEELHALPRGATRRAG